MTYPYNGGWNPVCEPPEPDPTLDDIPETIHDDNRKIVADELCELDSLDARDTFIAWLADEGEAQMIWSVLASNLPLMRQFRESDTAKKIIEQLKDDRMTKQYLSGKPDYEDYTP
jgi:hypothetical protein